MLDQLRWDAPGYAGGSVAKTPVMDELAESGVVFENAYCASPVCSPARASWVTGLYPHGHHQYINYAPKIKDVPGCAMDEGTTTIGDILKNEGYTCGIAGVWHLSDDDEIAHGFTDYSVKYSYHDLSLPDPHFAYLDELGIVNPYDPANGMIEMVGILPYADLTDGRQQRTTWVVDRSLEFLDSLDPDFDDPFFLMVGIKDPHPTMAPPPDCIREYRAESMPIPANFRDRLDGKPGYQAKGRRHVTEQSLSEDGLRRIMQHYYALVAHIDGQIGRIIDLLERKGLIDDTILILNSDHGEQLGNHGFVEKGLMYEESARIPCVVSWPGGLRSGGRIAAPLAGVDLMPTLLELAGCPAPENIDGRSVAEQLRRSTEPDPVPVFAEIGDIGIYGNRTDPELLACHIMALHDGFKYVWNRDDQDELYDLANDPAEMENLAGEQGQKKRILQMRAMVRELIVKTGPDQYEWCLW